MNTTRRLFTLLVLITLGLQTMVASAFPTLPVHAMQSDMSTTQMQHDKMPDSTDHHSCENHHHLKAHPSSDDCCQDECDCMPQACASVSVYIVHSLSITEEQSIAERFINVSGMVRKSSSSLFRPPIA
ncbi:CopL family metal-binding regulatory protein [Alteromonas sp. ASW11-130]|uniref:CopL family metal-binding regulatory protein n=1 Tax=Alteromonas sp. ASW11-130 TaxID=3015775 RepID=UPI0022423155|nr:CopL family metal-binding regulatory protein [Alteromonas sp. ASW11-130]MCW8091141.1 CopL family metal-binding regulatory protein [Alteromonas sp. ASW11-130]